VKEIAKAVDGIADPVGANDLQLPGDLDEGRVNLEGAPIAHGAETVAVASALCPGRN